MSGIEPGTPAWTAAHDAYLTPPDYGDACDDCECADHELPGENVTDDGTGYEKCECTCHWTPEDIAEAKAEARLQEWE